MARFKLFGRREGAAGGEVHREADESGNLEVVETPAVVESIGTKYTMFDGQSLDAGGRFGPEDVQKGREGWIEVIAAKDDKPAGLFDTYESRDTSNVTGGGATPGVTGGLATPGITGEEPQGLFWQGLVENQNIVGRGAEPAGFHALTRNEAVMGGSDDGQSMLLSPQQASSGELVFEKVDLEDISTDLDLDAAGIMASDDWQAPDV